jgi:transposase-like protein
MGKRRKSRRQPLDEQHFRAVKLLADSRLNHEDVARQLGVCRMTLYRWRQRPDFKRALQREINRVMDAKFRELQNRYMPRTAGEIEHLFKVCGLL